MWIKELVEASNEKHALSLVHQKYGRLTKLDISIITELREPLEEIERTRQYFSSSGYNDEDIIEMIKKINSNEGSQEYYSAIEAHFSPILNSTLANYRYSDLTQSEKDHYKFELLKNIIKRFVPKFSPNEGRLLSFIKMKVNDSMATMYKRQKYVNSNSKKNTRLRSEVMTDYAETQTHIEDIDLDIQQLNLIRIIKKIGKYNEVDNIQKQRRKVEETHEHIYQLGLHEYLTKKKQKEIYILYYGPKQLKQKEIAKLLNVTQPNVSITLRRAKKNIWDSIFKKNIDE